MGWVTIGGLTITGVLTAFSGDGGYRGSEPGLLSNRWYVGSQIEAGEQRLQLNQSSGDQVEFVTSDRQRLLLGFVAPQGIRLELSHWQQENSNNDNLPELDKSRGVDVNLVTQQAMGALTPFLSLGLGVFSYDEPITLDDLSEREISGQQYSIAIGSHWLPVPWLELSLSGRYYQQESDRDRQSDASVLFRGEGQSVDFGLNLVF